MYKLSGYHFKKSEFWVKYYEISIVIYCTITIFLSAEFSKINKHGRVCVFKNANFEFENNRGMFEFSKAF